MATECQGECFEQKLDGYVKKAGNKCKCDLYECSKCKKKFPLEILDSNHGYCQICAVQIHDVYLSAQKELGFEKSDYGFLRFADLLAEFY